MNLKEYNKEMLTREMFQPLDKSEQNSEFIAMETKSFARDAWIRFKRNKLALLGLIFLGIVVVLAIFVPIFSPYTYEQMDMTALSQSQSGSSYGDRPVWTGYPCAGNVWRPDFSLGGIFLRSHQPVHRYHVRRHCRICGR